jgi:uncharacterized protein (DUF2164 family)
VLAFFVGILQPTGKTIRDRFTTNLYDALFLEPGSPMSKIDLSHSEREMLREKLQRYCADNFDLELEQFDAEFFVDFVIENIGPTLFNAGIDEAIRTMPHSERIQEEMDLKRSTDLQSQTASLQSGLRSGAPETPSSACPTSDRHRHDAIRSLNTRSVSGCRFCPNIMPIVVTLEKPTPAPPFPSHVAR